MSNLVFLTIFLVLLAGFYLSYAAILTPFFGVASAFTSAVDEYQYVNRASTRSHELLIYGFFFLSPDLLVFSSSFGMELSSSFSWRRFEPISPLLLCFSVSSWVVSVFCCDSCFFPMSDDNVLHRIHSVVPWRDVLRNGHRC